MYIRDELNRTNIDAYILLCNTIGMRIVISVPCIYWVDVMQHCKLFQNEYNMAIRLKMGGTCVPWYQMMNIHLQIFAKYPI